MKDRSHDRFESGKIRGEMFEIAQDPHDETDPSKPTLRSFRRYDEFKVHERFRYIIRLWSTKIRLDGKGATTRSVCWDTLEQVTNVAVARK